MSRDEAARRPERLSRREFLRRAAEGLAAGAAAAALPRSAWSAPPPRTSFVVMLADDTGYGDLSCFGHPITKTPNLDRLAQEGVRLTDCYAAAPICSPSRAGMLTGRTPYRTGITGAIGNGQAVHLRLCETTVAGLLRKAGYATCHVGKWHLAGDLSRHPGPNEHGFDHAFYTQNNAQPSHKDPDAFWRNGKKLGKLSGYSPALVVDEAIQWLTGLRQRDWDRPFFLFVCFHNTHGPLATAPEYMNMYGGRKEAIYYGNATQMDHEAGRLVRFLDEVLRVRDDTFVFFTSDNGPAPPGNAAHPYGSAGPFKGSKLTLEEGGIRVSGIVRWPGRAKPATVCDEPVCGIDLLPTVCEIAGVGLPAGRAIDGASFLPVFDGKPVARAQPLYWQFNGHHQAPKYTRSFVATRVGDYKLTTDKSCAPVGLFNLKNDVREDGSLDRTEPARARSMLAQLEQIHASVQRDLAESAAGMDYP